MSYSEKDLLEWIKEIYSFTILFPKKEPLRYKLRKIANDILEKFIFWKKKNPSEKEFLILTSYLELLNFYFEIVKSQNWVSPKEISNLQQKYNQFLEILKKEKLNNQNQIFREEKILKFLKEKEKVQVRQLKEILPQVSKRTLRRDLQKLVKKGLVEKIGEKRKTFYKLKL